MTSALLTTRLAVRPAGVDDVVALAALKRRVERRCYGALGSEEALQVRLHRRCTAWYLLTRIGEGDLLLVAEVDGAPVGLGAARVDGMSRLHLHSTYVEQRGLGAGRALTRARLEAGDQLGLRVVTADCLVPRHSATRTAAEERLSRLGLRQVGRTDSPTFPGADQSAWRGSLRTALARSV